jgi:branched-chain amino acid aminotransferase
MEAALLNYFLIDTDLRSTCDFNPYLLEKGISVYEVIRVEEGIPIFLQEHIVRFFSSLKLEKLSFPFSESFIRKAIHVLIRENGMQQGNIKFLLWEYQSEQHFMAWVMPFFYPAAHHYAEGVSVGSMPAERVNPNAKKALHDLRKRADDFIRKENLWETIYVNRSGEITEGSRSNIFFVKDGQLVTPELALVLPGVTRSKILFLARREGVRCLETRVKLKEVHTFDACFLTGTSPKVLPVALFNKIRFDVHNALMRQMMALYDELVVSDKRRFTW